MARQVLSFRKFKHCECVAAPQDRIREQSPGSHDWAFECEQRVGDSKKERSDEADLGDRPGIPKNARFLAAPGINDVIPIRPELVQEGSLWKAPAPCAGGKEANHEPRMCGGGRKIPRRRRMGAWG